MTTRTNRRRIGGLMLGTAVLGGLLTGLFTGSPALAIPADGPGADTPGTSSSVSPTTLTPCATIKYSVSGYPPGETLYIKIDDGVGYGDTSVQGSGVYATQAVNSSGKASGSFELPCNITPGSHWLRMLASEYVDSSDPGKGVWGFTRRGGNDFTVVAATGGTGNTGSNTSGSGGSNSGGGGGGGGTGLGGQAPQSGQVAGSGAEQVAGEGGTLGIDASLVTPTEAPAASAGSGEAQSAPVDVEAVSAPASESGGIPLVGLIGGGALVLISAAIAVWFFVLRRGSRPTAG